jgi:AcrR family transcriptional regulator
MTQTDDKHAEKHPTRRAVDKIRDSARELFYAEGIRAVGVDEIVNRAGVTKPSLYRGFGSKDELAVAVLRDSEAGFWARFDASVAAHPGDVRAQLMDFFEGLGQRSSREDYRGCGLTNAMIEYPEPGHPARVVSEAHKRDLRARLRGMAAELGAKDADGLGDALTLLVEGAYVSSQIFGAGGPSAAVAQAAAAVMDSFA